MDWRRDEDVIGGPYPYHARGLVIRQTGRGLTAVAALAYIASPMRLIRTLSTVFLVGTTGWTQPSALVLCIAPGGHVAIESGQDRCTAPDDAAKRDHGSSTSGLAHTDVCCTPCADLPLGTSVFVRASGSRDDLQQLKAPAALATAATPPACMAQVGDNSPKVSLHGAVRLSTPVLQTVILRC